MFAATKMKEVAPDWRTFVNQFGGSTIRMYEAFFLGKMTPEQDYEFVMNWISRDHMDAYSRIIAAKISQGDI